MSISLSVYLLLLCRCVETEFNYKCSTVQEHLVSMLCYVFAVFQKFRIQSGNLKTKE